MIPHLIFLCLATTSYAVTLFLEITRLFFRSGVRGALMLGFAGMGLAMHALFLIQRWTHQGAHTPLSSEFDWYLVAAWLLRAPGVPRFNGRGMTPGASAVPP